MKITRRQLIEIIEETMTEQRESNLWQVVGVDYDSEEIIAVFTDRGAADSFLSKYSALMDKLGYNAPWDPKNVSVVAYTPPPTDPDVTALLKLIWDSNNYD
jgi:hypothetical protein